MNSRYVVIGNKQLPLQALESDHRLLSLVFRLLVLGAPSKTCSR